MLPSAPRLHLVVLCTLLATGCQRNWAMSKDACRDRLAQLSKRLELVRDVVNIPQAIVAPASETRRSIRDVGPVLTLVDGKTSLDGRTIAETIGTPGARAELRTDLEILERNWTTLHPDQPRHDIGLYVVAKPDLSASQLFAALADVPPPYQARLIVRASKWERIDPLPIGASAELRGRVAAIQNAPDADRAQPIADLLAESRRNCGALDDTFTGLGSVSDANKDDVVIERVPRVIAGCECVGVDMDAVEAALLLVMPPWDPPLGWLPIRLAVRSEPDAELVALPASATVADVASALERAEAANKRIYFAASK